LADLSHAWLVGGDLERAAVVAARAVAAAGPGAPVEVGFVDLVLRSDIATRSRRGLDRIEEELGPVLAHMPFFAQAWRAQLLLAAGRRDEVEVIWRTLAPHVTAMPEAPVEWLIAVAGFARIAVALHDRAAARELYALLQPVDGFQSVGDAQTPVGGPVSLLLGQLALLLEEPQSAGAHFRDAVREADALGDVHHARLARVALRGRTDRGEPLSPREREIARLIAEGESNRSIGAALHLSVRTVESHVSHILTKLGLDSRTAIVRWYLRSRQD
jgi:DNA-binding CsgD family transcriptional regulator